jgi:DNA polymerase-3 subunit chi
LAGAAQRVQFYLLTGSDERRRLKLGCRIAERAALAQQRVLVWLEDAGTLARFDELLWTFADRSFVPHEIYAGPEQWQDTPVLLCCEGQPRAACDLLVNLGAAIPEAAVQAGCVAEILDEDEQRLSGGRQRFRRYRERGLTPQTHRLASEEAALPP